MTNKSAQMAAQTAAREASRMNAIAAQMSARARAMARQAAARAWAMQRQGAARAWAMQLKMAAQRRRKEVDRRRAQVVESLYDAVSQPLDCQPISHGEGAHSLLFGHNWTDSGGTNYTVLRCNTVLPGSNRPAALLLWSGDDVRWVDLTTTTLADLVKRGRLFLYPASFTVPEGDSFAVLPSSFESLDGTIGSWSFPTLGTYHGQSFFVGAGRFGTFFDPARRGYMVARPVTWNDEEEQWFWYGRSSTRENGKLALVMDACFDRNPHSIRFLIPPLQNDPISAALRCLLRDDFGDPIAVFDPQAERRNLLIARGDTLYLVCTPNQKSADGSLVFVAHTKAANDGAMVCAGSGSFGGNEILFELEANDKDQGAQPIFTAPVNARSNDMPLVLIPLRKLKPGEREANACI